MAPRKSPDAFRTISEVADWLGVNAHVLRFWESKFTQIKPVKRAGGRRYYRKSDMELLGGLKQLLHEDGLTIKGAQKILKEQGVKAVAALSPPVDTLEMPAADALPPEAQDAPVEPSPIEDSPPQDTPVEPVAAEWVAQQAAPDAPATDAQIPDVSEENDPLQPSLFDGITSRNLPPDLKIEPLPELPSEAAARGSAEKPGGATAEPEPEPEAPTPAIAGTPEIAPLPGSEVTLVEALHRLVPGQIAPSELAPILSRARNLRARMDSALGA